MFRQRSGECEKMFEFIQEKQLDEKTITDLKQYINDIINCEIVLNKFEEWFYKDLTMQGETFQLLQIKNYDELFNKLKIEETINNLVLQTLKRFKFTTQHIKLQSINHPAIVQSYFLQCARISHHQLFKSKCLSFVHRQLKKQSIDYHRILQNKQDILKCSNVKQAIIKSLEQKVIELLCHFLHRIISNNFVFNFEPMSLIEYYGNMQNIGILKEFNIGEEKMYKQMFEQFFDEYVMSKDKQIAKKFSRGIESNVIEINFPTCFPLILKQYSYIFIKSDTNKNDQMVEKVQNYTNKLLQYSLSEEKKDDTLFQINYNKALSIFSEKTKLNSQKQQLKGNKYEYWSKLNKIGENNLYVGYLFDVLHYICTETEMENKYLCKLLDMVIWLFEDLSLENKIVLLTMDRNFWSRILQILMVLFKYEDHIAIQQFIEDELKNDIEFNRTKSEDSKPQQILSQLIIKLGSKIMLLVGNFLRLTVEKVAYYGIQKYIQFFKQISVPVRKMLTSYQEYGLSIDENFLVTIKLIQLFEKINGGDVAKLIEQFVVDSEENGCYPKRIYYYVKILIDRYCDDVVGGSAKKVEILLNYLAFNIFCSWYNIAIYQSQANPQIEEVVNHFINFSNQYPYFANNSVFFFQQLFNQFLNAVGYDQKIQSLSRLPNKVLQMINKQLSMQNNFSVALANFFSDKLKNQMEQQVENAMIEGQNLFLI